MCLAPARVVAVNGIVGRNLGRRDGEKQVLGFTVFVHRCFIVVGFRTVFVGSANGVHDIQIQSPANQVPATVAFQCQFLGTFFKDSRT